MVIEAECTTENFLSNFRIVFCLRKSREHDPHNKNQFIVHGTSARQKISAQQPEGQDQKPTKHTKPKKTITIDKLKPFQIELSLEISSSKQSLTNSSHLPKSQVQKFTP